jgi:hypothetical protein
MTMGDAMFAAQINYVTASYSNMMRWFAIRQISIKEMLGGLRQYRMQLVKKAVFKRWLEDSIERHGHYNTWSLFGEPVIARFLRHQGFKRIELADDHASFTAGVALGWLPLPVKRRQFFLPRWAIIYSEVEVLAKKKSGNISHGEALSLFDTMEVYDHHAGATS